MKKICLLLALCLMLSIFSACGSPSEPSSAATTAPTASSPSTEAPTDAPVPSTAPAVRTKSSTVIDFSLEAPEGFTASVEQDDFTFLVSPDSPTDTSSITVEVLPQDESALQRSEGEFETLVTGGSVPEQTQAPDAPPGPKDYTLTIMQPTKVDGWPALLCEYDLTFTGFSSHIVRYEVVVNHANYVFTFTDTTEERVWTEDFARSAKSIHLILDSEEIVPDYSDLTRYDLTGGLSIYAADGLQPHKAEGFTACIGSSDVIILLMAENKQANHLTGLDALGYADVLRQSNELDEFQTNAYGDLYTHFYTTDDTGAEYYNMICIKETDDAFCVLQFTCSKENQALYAKQFPLWASSFTQAK